MAKSSHSSESLEDIIREEKIVDHDSDTVVEEGEVPEPDTSASGNSSRIAPNPFPERSTAQALTALRASTTPDEPIIINKLDEQKQRYIEENKRSKCLYRTLAIAKARRFKPLSVDELLRKFLRHPLTSWPTGREATTSDDIVDRDTLRYIYIYI